MNTQRWDQINQLFHEALAQEPDQLPAFLAQSCPGDELLRGEIESLIRSHKQAENFIENPASDIAAELIATGHGRLQVGQKIGHYKILRSLGAGGMGEVYLAQDTQLDRLIALKLLPTHFTIDVERVRRFEQEARAASALNHPNIVTIYEIGSARYSHFIATEFIDGETLRQRMKNGCLTLNQALDVATQVASALAVAHAAGIVHRDIKPENIMLRRDGFVKVLDFGLAKLTLENSPHIESNMLPISMVNTNPGSVMGTVPYLSPEQARAQETDRRTDIWSLGVVLYEMVIGQTPFIGETPADVIAAIVESEPAVLARDRELPSELDRIITKALNKKKHQRYQTADEMAADLRNLKQELEIEARLKRFSGQHCQAPVSANESGQTNINSKPLTSDSNTGLGSQQQYQEVHSNSSTVRRIGLRPWMLATATLLLGALIILFVRPDLRSSLRPTSQQQSQMAETSTPERTLTYWLLVSRQNDQHQFESIGSSVFEEGSKFWFNIQTHDEGALYLFSYGRNDDLVYEWNTMFPTPVNNGGDAWLPANHANPLRTKTAYFLEGKSGIVELWIVWAIERIPVLDEITRESYKTLGTVREETAKTNLRLWLEQNRPTQEIIIDKENARVTLRGRSAVLIDRRELEYRPTAGG